MNSLVDDNAKVSKIEKVDMKEEKDRIKRIRGLYDNKKSKKDGSWDFANFKSFYYSL